MAAYQPVANNPFAEDAANVQLPPTDENQARREAMQEMEEELERMEQYAIGESALHGTGNEVIFKQLALNCVGCLLFVVTAVAVVQLELVQTRHVCIMLLCEYLAFTVVVLVLGIFLEMVWRVSGPSMGTYWDSSPLWNAIKGREQILLRNKGELYAFTHAINKGARGYRVDLVRSLEDTPNKVLILGNPPVELEPSKFWVREIWSGGKAPRERLLQKALGSTWVVEKGVQPIACTFFDSTLQELHERSDFPCRADLKRRNPCSELFLHPAVCMVLSVGAAVLLFTPTVYWAYNIIRLHGDICSGDAQRLRRNPLPRVLSAEGAELVKLCDNFADFAAVVHDELHISKYELILSWVLAIVIQVVFAVLRAVRLHSKLRRKFLILKPGQSAEEKHKLMEQMDTFEQYLSPGAVVARSLDLLRTFWERPSACGPLERIDTSSTRETAFARVIQPLLQTMRESDKLEAWALPVCREERKSCDRVGRVGCATWKRKCERSKEIWLEQEMKLDLLQVKPDLCKFMCLVPMNSKEALDLFTLEFLQRSRSQGGYQEQLKAIFDPNTVHAQERMKSEPVHLEATLRLGPLIVPQGYTLTHILVNAPGGAGSKAVALGTGLFRTGFRQTRIKELEELNRALGYEEVDVGGAQAFRMERFEAYFGTEVILPTTKSGTDGTMAKLADVYGDDAAYNFFFVFQLTQPYQASLGMEESNVVDQMKSFFCNLNKACGDTWPASKTQLQQDFMETASEDYHSSIFCCLVKQGRIQVFGTIGALFKNNLLWEVFLLALCGVVPLVVPICRVLREGGGYFPAPLAKPLAMNAFFQAVALFAFLGLFANQTKRLKLVSTALSTFEQLTLQRKGALQHGGGNSNSLGSASAEVLNSFQLVLRRRDKYDPLDEKSMKLWSERWTDVGQNVEDWHVCQTNLRVLSSTSRLTSQFMIALAGLILGLLFVGSFIQAVQGRGALRMDREQFMANVNRDVHGHLQGQVRKANDTLKGITQNISKGLAGVVGRLGPAQKGRRLAKGLLLRSEALAEGEEEAGEASSTEEPSRGPEGPLLEAARSLREALRPVRSSLHTPLQRQLQELRARRLSAEDYIRTVQGVDLRKISKVQILSLAFFALLFVFSARLVYWIATINQHFDRHASILVEQKTQHRYLQTGREQKAPRVLEDGEEEEGTNESERPEGRSPFLFGTQATKDSALRRYEKMLDTAIESSRNASEQFHLQLFGYKISFTLLAFWWMAGTVTLLQKASCILPGLVEDGCEYMGKSWGTAIQDQLDRATDLANAPVGAALDAVNSTLGGRGAEEADAELVPQINVREFWRRSVCRPLVSVVSAQTDRLREQGQDALDALDNKSSARRLQSAQLQVSSRGLAPQLDLELLLLDWWDRTPGSGQGKLLLAELHLQELTRSSRRLLHDAPRAVGQVFTSRGLDEAIAVAEAHARVDDF